MRMKICQLLIAYCLLPTSFLFAQENMYVPKPIQTKASSSELGVFLGGSYYIGDLNPTGHFNRFTRPAAGAIFRYNFNTRFAAKAFLGFGRIEADDAYSDNDSYRNRNLSFQSKLTEFSVQGEFNFIPFATGSKKYAIITPYIFLGVGLFHFNPQGYYAGQWFDLQPLGTEGQGTTFTSKKRYSLTQFSVPFGVGIKINTAKVVGIALEWGMRKTYTDYLDDVSGTYVDPVSLANEHGPVAAALSDKSLKRAGSDVGRNRGNSISKDWYAFAGVILTLKLKGEERCDMPR